MAAFERYLEALQRYLRGESIDVSELDFHERVAPPVASLGLADTPSESRIHWIDPSRPKVPVEVAATGPRVIASAARHADRVMFALGADPERIAWGIDEARRARSEAGLPADELRFGAYVNLVCHADADTARKLVAGGLSTFARFAVMHGRTHGPVTSEQKQVLERVHAAYDMHKHTRVDSDQSAVLTPEFIDRYAVVGPPGDCIARLEALGKLGVDKVIVIGPTAGADRTEAARSAEMLAQDVLPAFPSRA